MKTDVAKQLHGRSDLHLLRKAFHICGGCILLYPLYWLKVPTEWMAALLSMLLAAVMSLEYARNNWPIVNEWAVKLMGPIMRQSEVHKISGIPFYLGSCLFSVLVFPQHIQILAILHLVFGDPSSSFFGVLWGKDKLFPNKSLQGTLGGLLVCSVVTGVYLYVVGIAGEKFLLLTMIGGFSGAIAELLPVNIDDNLAIPVVSGLILTAAFWFAGIPLAGTLR